MARRPGRPCYGAADPTLRHRQAHSGGEPGGEPGLPIDHLARPLPAYVPPVPEPVALPRARLPRPEHHTTSLGDARDRAVAAQPAAVVCLVLSAGQPVAGCLYRPLLGVLPVPPDGRLVTLRGHAAGNGPRASRQSACPSGETPRGARTDGIRGRAAPRAFIIPSP